ncbi:MAG: nucleoside hydrolase [Lachnospiraceae bacterium]|nr:nucleoside hydrolase [Lachnospiraceae bacterium]
MKKRIQRIGKSWFSVLLMIVITVSLCACSVPTGSGTVDDSSAQITDEGASDRMETASGAGAQDGKRRIIIDTDTGADDASALILAAMMPDVEIVGVTVLVGNVDLEQSTRNAFAALEMAGCEAPVYKGSADSYDGKVTTAFSVFGKDGMGDAGLIHPKKQASEGDAIDFMINTVKENPGEIEILALGPATNIAKAIKKDPEAMKKVKRIWTMGSAGLGHGNASPVAEFNVYADAHAYQIMLESGLPITVVGLDVCGKDAEWTNEQFLELGAAGPVGEFVAKSFGEIRKFYVSNGSDTVMNCDALAVMCALSPDFVRSTIKTHASCIYAEGETYAQVLFYKEGFTYDAVKNDYVCNVDLVTEVDQSAFFRKYVEAILCQTAGEAAKPDGNGAESEKGGSDIYILMTSDVHCGVDKGFGYAGLKQLRDSLEKKGCRTLLVDDGDSIQGEPIGTLSRGETIIDLMNSLHYDVAIPGNHEFDYGMDDFLKLTEKAEFPYISCNFNKEGKLVFEPYVIKEICGVKIGFVGVTTPATLITSTPGYFQDANGKYIYGFMQDKDGSGVYSAVQKAVDSARAEGASLIYVMGHMGMEAECAPYTYADVISNTTGIDVFLDGHSHDTDRIVMKNKNGEDVTRIAVGTKLASIGYSHISADGQIVETGIWNWSNDESFQDLFSCDNEVADKIAAAKEVLDQQLGGVAASTEFELTIYDPTEKDESGKPIRMVRRAETNLGDFCADAYRDQGKADIGFVNGGGIRASFPKGDITYADIISVHPFGNALSVIEVTGQQILDALEWGAKELPGEYGGFLQVSGLTYEINVGIESGCMEDENAMFAGIKGERRVRNVMVGGKPIDPKKTYTLAGHNYMLLKQGDGFRMFDGAKVLQDSVKLDNQMLIDYLGETLGGVIGEEYCDPCGQGRIKIIE